MSEYYTNVAISGDNILLRGMKDGQRVKERNEFRPTLFVPSNKKSKYTTLDNEYVESIQPGTIGDCRSFIKQYEGIKGFKIYGNTDYLYQFIGSEYKGNVDYKFDELKIAYIDIETTCEHGFPQVDDPKESIITITVDFNGWKYVFGLGDFTLPEDPKLRQFTFDTEEELIKSFLDVWELESPDIMTGWNIRFFDIPYMYSRIARLLGQKEAKRLSPWRTVRQRTVRRMNKDQECYELIGIATLDYYELYLTFTYTNQESYRLDHIANIELGEQKLSYEEFDNIKEFYKNDFQKFVEYNVKDVDLVIALEDKMKLLELACALAYSAKVNFSDVFSQVKTWDCIIYHYLSDHNIVIPPKKHGTKDEKYAGAYVKDPITGMHDWVVSFDLNSLYPHLIMQYNISPETKVSNSKDHSITPDSILQGKDVPHDAYSVAANGTCYTREHQGFLPALMEKMYKERKMFKKKMIECQKEKQNDPTNKQLDYDISKYNNFQLVRKIQLNSAYGAIGNEWFRYYDVDMAEAITLSGQLSIRWIADKLNDFLNKTIGTEDYDYVIASDTDSVYVRLGKLVDKVCANKSKTEIVDFLDKSSKDIILPFMKKQYDILACKMNAYENKMVMDRECIADKGIWTAKKRYILNVYDSEGVRYKEPKMKIMGIETTRSSTPQVVRQKLKDAIKLIVTTDEDTIIDFIEEFKNEFHTYEPEDVAFPRGVSNISKYRDSSSIYKKGTPIAVKGALLYNNKLKELKLERKYSSITDGEKIKFVYMKKPNPIGGNDDVVISFPNSIPKEFDLSSYIDYTKQFEKSFLDPLKNILDMINWNYEKTSSLESFFC